MGFRNMEPDRGSWKTFSDAFVFNRDPSQLVVWIEQSHSPSNRKANPNPSHQLRVNLSHLLKARADEGSGIAPLPKLGADICLVIPSSHPSSQPSGSLGFERQVLLLAGDQLGQPGGVVRGNMAEISWRRVGGFTASFWVIR